ncbi:Tripartite ATP-independent periplasmic transporters, DctQ component [Rhodobacteraceae bacterium THAF1]|uniref:TRAP transporter small permease n=1 Tax=Palleronia sp. THAF1 TaxID=2587842 RepID=UPI000F3E1EFF|nr:TRAP transporter small permease [Palleronia sp. THAF1]QFU09216.1 Tripartite ATP-independent periplasmic transporter, DctQ component [Palleronia sp. THAF1]VDC27341.1 Tripartite ATP-independent periplasmic transporters, DctQ component [Rhodobacteraceae bacterium THAF1]
MPLRISLERIIRAWALLGGLVLLVIVGLTAVNAAGFTADAVAGALGGNVSGLPGYEDAVTLFVGVAALAMFPYCQMVGGHAAVDVFMSRAPGWANRSVALLSGLLIAAFAIWLAWMLSLGTLETRSDATETAVLGWPVWIFMPTAVVSCVLWALATLLQTFGAPDGA